MLDLKILLNLIRRKQLADGIVRRMASLAHKGESVLFVSVHSIDELANVVICLSGDIDNNNSDNEGYLQLRKLLNTLKDKLDEKGALSFKYTLTRKAKGR